MTTITRWTVDVVATLPQIAGGRYEIIDGELFVTHQPHARHQAFCDNVIGLLRIWGDQTRLGRTFQAPGVIFSAADAVAPDLIWVRYDRLDSIWREDGTFYAAPDLVIEVLSPGKSNEERDRELKLAVYDRHAVPEYWIADWRAQTLEIYRRDPQDALVLFAALNAHATLTSPLLPGFSVQVSTFFEI